MYDFVAKYWLKTISRGNEDEIMRFASQDHAQHSIQGVCRRDNFATPLVSFLDFPTSSGFSGNILDESVETNAAMEKYAKAVLCLFVPFRDEEQFDMANQESSYVARLREAKSTDELSIESIVRLQNIQNCHNMMKAGCPDDVLERTTHALPDPTDSRETDHDMETQRDIDNHIEMHLTELVADLDANNAIQESNSSISLNKFRKNGKK